LPSEPKNRQGVFANSPMLVDFAALAQNAPASPESPVCKEHPAGRRPKRFRASCTNTRRASRPSQRLGSFGLVLASVDPIMCERSPERIREIRSQPFLHGAGIIRLSGRVLAYLAVAKISTLVDLIGGAKRGLDREFARHPEDLAEVHARLAAY